MSLAQQIIDGIDNTFREYWDDNSNFNMDSSVVAQDTFNAWMVKHGVAKGSIVLNDDVLCFYGIVNRAEKGRIGRHDIISYTVDTHLFAFSGRDSDITCRQDLLINHHEAMKLAQAYLNLFKITMVLSAKGSLYFIWQGTDDAHGIIESYMLENITDVFSFQTLLPWKEHITTISRGYSQITDHNNSCWLASLGVNIVMSSTELRFFCVDGRSDIHYNSQTGLFQIMNSKVVTKSDNRSPDIEDQLAMVLLQMYLFERAYVSMVRLSSECILFIRNDTILNAVEMYMISRCLQGDRYKLLHWNTPISTQYLSVKLSK